MKIRALIKLMALLRVLMGTLMLVGIGGLIMIALGSSRITAMGKVLGILFVACFVLYVLNGIRLLRLQKSAVRDARILDVFIIIGVTVVTYMAFIRFDIADGVFELDVYRLPLFLIGMSVIQLVFFSSKIRARFPDTE